MTAAGLYLGPPGKDKADRAVCYERNPRGGPKDCLKSSLQPSVLTFQPNFKADEAKKAEADRPDQSSGRMARRASGAGGDAEGGPMRGLADQRRQPFDRVLAVSSLSAEVPRGDNDDC